MSVESNIFNRLIANRQKNESINYEFNQNVASEIGSALPNNEFSFKGMLTDNHSVNIPIDIIIRLNENDIEAVESNNVVYLYLNTDNIDYSIIIRDDMHIKNFSSFINSRKRFVKVDSKCWRDDNKLYLLKMNKNTGIVSRFDRSTGTFKRQINNMNYQVATNKEIAEYLLTVDYLTDYLSSQLVLIRPTIDPITGDYLSIKQDNERIVKEEYLIN